MKALITGTSAQHYSRSVAQRTTTYAGMLANGLEKLGYEVDHAEPSVVWDKQSLSEYDKVFVGITSPLSLSANGSYGALNAVSLLFSTEKLALFIDAPEPGKIFSGLRAITKDPKQLFKQFYVRRSGYDDAQKDSELASRIYDGVEKLFNSVWPTTLWPTLPWYADSEEIVGVPDDVKSAMVGLSFDALSISKPGMDALRSPRQNVWGVDLASAKWVRSLANTMAFPQEQIKNKKQMSDVDIDARLATLHGAIFAIHDDKRPWWSPLIARALSTATPIVTDWKYSQRIGESWSVLAATVEEMSRVDAYELSVSQAKQYTYKIQTEEEILTTLRRVVD